MVGQAHVLVKTSSAQPILMPAPAKPLIVGTSLVWATVEADLVGSSSVSFTNRPPGIWNGEELPARKLHQMTGATAGQLWDAMLALGADRLYGPHTADEFGRRFAAQMDAFATWQIEQGLLCPQGDMLIRTPKLARQIVLHSTLPFLRSGALRWAVELAAFALLWAGALSLFSVTHELAWIGLGLGLIFGALAGVVFGARAWPQLLVLLIAMVVVWREDDLFTAIGLVSAALWVGLQKAKARARRIARALDA